MVRALFSWDFVGPHHLARVRACGAHAIEARMFALSDRSRTYSFYNSEEARPDVTVAYPTVTVEDLPFARRLVAYMRHVWTAREDVYFLCHYERPEVFLTALVLRLRLKKVFVMNDSKFDDYQRHILREFGKALLYTPYCGALVSGTRSASYLRFLGVRGKIEQGYDTIDTRQPIEGPAELPAGLTPKGFFVVISRLVQRKNIDMVIRAFAAMGGHDEQPVKLVIAGEGSEEEALRKLASTLNVDDRVHFLGTVPYPKIPSLLTSALALLLMSRSEQWGLVVNEALAHGLPVIVSDAVGARDTLVRNFVNGFVVESDNVQGLARAMRAVRRQADDLVPPASLIREATAERFADAVVSLLRAPNHR